jgi:hypothetical protein
VRQETRLSPWETISNVILIGGGLSCGLVAGYYFYHYSLTGERQFTSPIGQLVYYYLPVALAALLFTALRLERSQKINIAVLCGSLALSVYVGELFLSIFDYSTLAGRAIWGGEVKTRKYEILRLAKDFGVDFDTRSGVEVLRDLRSKGIDAVPPIFPSGLLNKQPDGSRKSALSLNGDEFLPLGGISNRVTVSCNEIGRYLHYESDEHGFHNPKGIWQSNSLDVVAVGDSFTQGGCAPSDKIFVALIRKRYPVTLNLGMAGNGPLTMLATLKEYLPFLRPKIVLWFYFEGSDADDLQNEHKTPLLMKYLNEHFSQNLQPRQTEIDDALMHYLQRAMANAPAGEPQSIAKGKNISTTLMELPKLSNWRRKLGFVVGETTGEATQNAADTDMTLFRTILSQAKASVALFGGTLYFVVLPAWERYGNPQVAKSTFRRYSSQVLATVENLGIPIVDVGLAFEAQNDPLLLFPYRRFGHYNEVGHRVVAETVLKAIP